MEKYLLFDVTGWYRTGLYRELKALGLCVLMSGELTRNLLYWDGWRNFDREKTLLVFPGNGASIVKDYLAECCPSWLSQWLWKASVPAKRLWTPGNYPVAVAGRINPGVLVGIKDVVIIDDVISSGETCRKILELNQAFIPGARWHAAAWVLQRSAKLKGFCGLFSPVEVGTDKSKAPVNSLSTLLECSDIAQSYAVRNFDNPEDLLSSLRNPDNFLPPVNSGDFDNHCV